MSDDAVVSTSAASQEAVVGERVGLDLSAAVPSIASDTLIGERIGRDIAAEVIAVTFEALISEPPIVAQQALSETLVSSPDEPLSQTHKATQAIVEATQWKLTPDPATVKSMTPVAGVFSLSIGGRDVAIPISDAIYAHTSLLAALTRDLAPADDVISPLDVGTAATMVTVSREKSYEPVSEVAVKAARTLAAAARSMPPADDVISPLDAGGAVTIVTMAYERPMPQGGQWAAQMFQMTVAARDLDASYTPPLVAQGLQQVVLARETSPPYTQAQVAQEHQQVVQDRAVATPTSPLSFAKLAEQVTRERPVAMHVSQIIIPSEVQLTVQARDTVPPGQMVGVTAGAAWEEVSRHRTVPAPEDMRSPLRAQQVRVTYNQGRFMPHPEDVTDPALGRHAAQLVHMTISFRATEPPVDPDEGARRLASAATAPVLGDTTFPPPPTEPIDMALARVLAVGEITILGDDSFPPQSRVDIAAIGVPVALGDAEGWADPTIPVSDVSVLQTGAFSVLAETTLPPADLPQSEARAHLVGGQLVIGDAAGWMDPTIPNSDVTIPQVFEHAILGDTTLPPGDQAQSDAGVSQVSASLVIADPTAAGAMPGSDVQVTMLLQRLVLADETMYRLPVRPAGPRPVISISIS